MGFRAAEGVGRVMDSKTLKALKGSIAKWEAIVAGTGVDKGPSNCPLCLAFWDNSMGEVSCLGCPVRDATGEDGCVGTPYEKWEDLTECKDQKADTPELKKAARAELRFLKSLLPRKRK